MKHLIQSLIISIAVIGIATPSFADGDREDRGWDRDKKEQSHHSKKDRHDNKERHRKGGIPRCEAELAECLINLTETENLLQACEDDLAQCQATEGQAFPATGQTTCWYQYVADPDCTNPASAGQDGDIQAGAELSYTVTDKTIIDNNTKLEWLKQDDNGGDCASLAGSLDKDCTFTWDEAFNFVASLNAANHAGGGWRVPNVKELQSILNYENVAPAVSAEFDAGCVAGCTVDACSCTRATDSYWSSTSAAFDPGNAWGFFIDSGESTFFDKSDDRHVRAVRGGL